MYSRILPTCTLNLIIVQMQEPITLYCCMLNLDNWCCWLGVGVVVG